MRYCNNLKGDLSFRSFVPPLMADYSICASPALTKAIEEAEASFDELNSRLLGGDEATFIRLMEAEARASYRLSEVKPKPCFSFGLTLGLDPNEENIMKATDYGMEAMTELPISTRLIKNLHYLVCGSSDYDKKYRGEIRNSPVWIGPPGATMDSAVFIPPVGDDLASSLSDLDNFMNLSELNPLVKAAMAHYQFEMIHPFIDANGRVGRILTALLFCESGRLQQPVLQLSEALSQNYKEYTDYIQMTNLTGDMERWLIFFLRILTLASRLTSQSLLR